MNSPTQSHVVVTPPSGPASQRGEAGWGYLASPHSGRAAALHQLLQIVEGLLADIVLYLLHLLQFIRGAVDPAEKTVEQVMAVEQIGPQFRSGGTWGRSDRTFKCHQTQIPELIDHFRGR